MRILFKPFILVSLLALGSLFSIGISGQDSNCSVECFKQNIQLQVADSNGFLVPNTQFWVTVDITKIGNRVSIQFPAINFQTLTKNAADTHAQNPGGYLYTVGGFLPPNICPNDMVFRSIVAASDSGATIAYSRPITVPPVPVNGYIFSITSSGSVAVQSVGSFGNLIPAGAQTIMPCEISYTIKPRAALCQNYIIDPGFTNTTQFTNSQLISDGFRDSHVCDVYDGVVAFAWVSNANVADKTNGTMNCFVAVGKVNSDGTLNIGAPVQLTNFPPGVQAWDTAVAINRSNPSNIVVSYGLVDTTTPAPHFTSTDPSCRAVSFDGGKTWPAPL